ncbi:Sperm-tail PG-rich repeat-containing protein 2, partial [Lemmus lemmus]
RAVPRYGVEVAGRRELRLLSAPEDPEPQIPPRPPRLPPSPFPRAPPLIAMYDRASRWLRLAQGGSTEEHVGPGTYQVPFPKPRATGGYAPFLSLSSRKTAYVVASDTEKAAPGPADYCVSEAQYKIKGGRSLQNREKRFKKLTSDGPGPASYVGPYPGTLSTTSRQKISRTPTVSRSLDIPSIPSSGKSHGYHLNDDDSIRKRTPPAGDDTIGPAYYKPQFDYPKSTLKYKGVNFGNATGRQELLKHSGPGPGQYDIIQKRRVHCENINIKKEQQQNKSIFFPRFSEEIILQEEKKANRKWHLKCCKNLGLFMTTTHICSWQYQSAPRG